MMLRTVEAVIDEDGNIHLREPVHFSTARRALVTILEDEPAETALLSESAFADASFRMPKPVYDW